MLMAWPCSADRFYLRGIDEMSKLAAKVVASSGDSTRDEFVRREGRIRFPYRNLTGSEEDSILNVMANSPSANRSPGSSNCLWTMACPNHVMLWRDGSIEFKEKRRLILREGMFSDAFDSMEALESVLELEKRKLQEVRSVHLVLSKTISSFRTDLETFQVRFKIQPNFFVFVNGWISLPVRVWPYQVMPALLWIQLILMNWNVWI
jgi:hypothetical protein